LFAAITLSRRLCDHPGETTPGDERCHRGGISDEAADTPEKVAHLQALRREIIRYEQTDNVVRLSIATCAGALCGHDSSTGVRTLRAAATIADESKVVERSPPTRVTVSGPLP